MKLAVEDTHLEIFGTDETVRMHLVPRRSCPGEQTRILIDVPGLPQISFLPEAVATAPMPEEWVWQGDLPGAQHLAELGVKCALDRAASQPGPEWRRRLMDCFSEG